ncbi:aminoglycoside phosphotransferase [Parvibaculum lavamentivorans DS-1]|uniref:Aminoglycoside phosphotransferase n=1 Tax=Parvibaculum lavamentivorans (strain DS-1 / DSM 13023 / NCIMB 13966) TaxID=402881 RepID=A7HPC5_PARL1|nr:phosphotransferase [Parvibaculum lavamentivorans]ABS61758.1 aminoglycoside phosphotransferase [Parvibaculum lavamentivorans DS-1]
MSSSREETIRAFLASAGWAAAERRPLAGDASTRRYERLSLNGRPAVLMDWPSGPDAPVVPGRAAYSRIAHLAEDCRPFVAIGEHLRRLGLAAPEIYAADLERGLLLLEDLGDNVYGELIARGAGPSGEKLDELYRAGIETLLRLQSVPAPAMLPVGDGSEHKVPHFDESVYRAELDVILDWYFPVVLKDEASPSMREDYHALWTSLRAMVDAGVPTLFLRDYHSPNMLWLGDRAGAARVGLIDYQDALIGNRAYDVVSFLQDARRDVPVEREQAMLAHYVAQANAELQGFDEEQFRASYATLGAERALRLIGLWPRLLKRDGKPQYMAHMPRTMDYLRRNLAHPALSDLRLWLDANVLSRAR